MFGYTFYRQFKYKLVTHARVFSLKPNFKISENEGLFLSSSLKFLSEKFGYDNMCSWKKIKNDKIKLPVKDGKIDFDFMEDIVSKLESEYLIKLEKYLIDEFNGDYRLTDKEQNVIDNYNNIEWGEFRIGDLFNKIPTIKLPYKADDLLKEPLGEYKLPCLTSSFKNQGLNYYVPEKGATILKDVISIPSNSDVYRVYYQSRKFTVLSDAYAIKYKLEDIKISPNKYLFMVACINKITDLPIYSYKNKLGGWNIVKNKYIALPVKDGNIDFDFIETYISALKKLAIKNVVLYLDKKIKDNKNLDSR